MRFLWTLTFLTVFVWSAIYPKEYYTWLLEVLPAIIGFAIVLATYQRYPLTPLSYGLILLHCIVLMIGGHYTYAEVPLFEYLKEPLGFERNNYDKVGHFMQGFAPAVIARELLIRQRVVNGRYWRDFLILCFCLALSAFYELIEWWVALLSETAAESFLGTQGYVWDTQSDMLLALIGAGLALLLTGALHDRQLRQLGCSASTSAVD